MHRMTVSMVRLLALFAVFSTMTLVPATSSAACQLYSLPSPVYYCSDANCSEIIGTCWVAADCKTTCEGSPSGPYQMYGGYTICEACFYEY